MRFGILVALATASVLSFSGLAAAQEEEEQSSGRAWDFEAYLEESHSWGHITVSAGPNFLRLNWDDVELGPEASADIRELADGAFSNEKDGLVSEEEKEQFLEAISSLFENQFARVANHHSVSGIVLIDNAEASEAEVTRVAADGLEGPVDQDGGITAAFTIWINFPNIDESKDVHTVRIDLGPRFIREGHEDEAGEFAGDLTLTFSGSDGWSIDAASIQPECAGDNYEGGHIVLTSDDIDCFTGRSGVLLAYAITGEGEAKDHFLPGFELGLLGLAAALGIVLRRRRL